MAHRAGCGPQEARQRLAAARQVLFAARRKRPRPHRDEKIIVEWNGLTISALAHASLILVDPGAANPYREAASAAARFIYETLYDATQNRLQRRWCDGQAAMEAVAADYAFLAQGLLDLYAASLEERWLRWAVRLGEAILNRFYDPEAGGIYMTAADAQDPPLMRIKEDMDNVTPSAAAVAALVLLRLARLNDREDFAEAARLTVDAVLARLSGAPETAPLMLVAQAAAQGPWLEIRLAGSPEAPQVRRMAAVAGRIYLPAKSVCLLAHRPGRPIPAPSLGAGTDEPAAFVCHARSCHPAVHDEAGLVTQVRTLLGDAVPPGVLEASPRTEAP